MKNKLPSDNSSPDYSFLKDKAIIFLLLLWFTVIIRILADTWPVLLFRVISVLYHLLFLSLLVLIMGAIGRKFLAKIGVTCSHFLEGFVFATSLGLFVISYLTLFLGAVRLLYPLSAFVLLFLLVLWSSREMKDILFSVRDNFLKVKDISLELFPCFLLVIIGLTLFLSFLNCFAPPISYDTVAYHLGVPNAYIKAGRIIALPYHVYSNFPYTMEMLYTFSLLTLGENLAKLMHWLAGILTATAIYSFGRKYYSSKIGLLSAAIFLNIPWTGKLLSSNYNDLGLSLFIFLSLFSLLNWLQDGKDEWLILAGIFTGVSIGTKYTALTFCFFFILIAILFQNAYQKRGVKRGSRLIGIYTVAALGIASPWFVKNVILTGNPVFPFLFNIFGGGNWGAYEAARFMRVHSPGDISLLSFFRKLWLLGVNCQMGWIFVLFLPFTIFMRKIRIPTKVLLIYFFYYYVVWFFFSHQVDRFILPGYAFLSLLVGYVVLSLPNLAFPVQNAKSASSPSIENINGGKQIFVFTITGFLLLLNLHQLIACTAFIDPLSVFSGRDSRERYLLGKLYYYPAMKFMNEQLSSDARILFIGDNRTYHCEREFVSNSPLDKDVIVELVREAGNSRDAAERLRRMGITHIYYSISELNRVRESYSSLKWKTKAESDIFKTLLEKHTEKLFEENGCIVLELK